MYTFRWKSFLPQLKVFYLLFYWTTTTKMRISISLLNIHTPIEGVKNFSFFDRVDFQILPEEKTQVNRLKTHHFVWKRNWVADFIFWNQNGRYPLKQFASGHDCLQNQLIFDAVTQFTL